MYNKIRDLLIDSANDFPYFIKSKYTKNNKAKIINIYLRLCVNWLLFPSKRAPEKLLGLKVNYFTYESFFLLFREIFLRNIYFFQSEKTNPIIIDSGANIGMATLYYKWLYPNATIYAFEPDPETFKILHKNISQNDLKDVLLFNVALTDKKGKVDLNTDLENPGLLSMSVIYKRKTKDSLKVASSSLSEFIRDKSIDFLKMDIEGAENMVIRELIKSKKIKLIKEMIIEYHHGINNNWQEFSFFLELLSNSHFRYRIESQAIPLSDRNAFQDILLYVYPENK